eukprot:CAMPEP_0173431484 /NCGR_PEP_ID=MMETSP1357-20121228/9610_1 /TAXON_ID=77926 /ORGANISM="Hemiselmis rufescens, Strain PCC563" /LENGTH=214 /DNA_ID=CAMNT_0014395969 /DNA_START=38 /DNA_END=679 /DNA_ORIENTATION=-
MSSEDMVADGASTVLSAEPEVIFLPKFENAGPAARSHYHSLDAEGSARVLVASVKSSGSLWIASSRGGVLVGTSKNSTVNPYSAAGHYTLVRHMQSHFGSGWKDAYASLLRHLEAKDVSIGCELVTRCLGDHASVPNEDHLVINAVLDRQTMEALPPSALLHLQREYGLTIPGMFVFERAAGFLEVFDRFRFDSSATWDQVSAAMEREYGLTIP